MILFRPLLHVFSIITTPSGKNLLNIQQQDFNLTNHFILNTHTHTMIALTPFIYSSCQRRRRRRRKKPSKIKSKGTSSYTNLAIQHTHTEHKSPFHIIKAYQIMQWMIRIQVDGKCEMCVYHEENGRHLRCKDGDLNISFD